MKLNPKNILIAVAINNPCKESLVEFFKGSDFSNSHVTLAHVFEIHQYINEFTPYTYPPEDQIENIKEEVENHLKNWEGALFEAGKEPSQVNRVCFFHSSPKEGMIDYINEHKFDLMVVATRRKSGLGQVFSSSFAQAMCNSVETPVLVLKEKNS
jgi:hypothetical protein